MRRSALIEQSRRFFRREVHAHSRNIDGLTIRILSIHPDVWDSGRAAARSEESSMSSIDMTTHFPAGAGGPNGLPKVASTPSPPSRGPSSTDDRVAQSRQVNEPDTAQRVLKHVAERALERPPRDIQKLSASAAKFLLINLEPALRLAQELREETMNRSGNDTTRVMTLDRNDRAAALLADPGL
jgi:hypothetical protein